MKIISKSVSFVTAPANTSGMAASVTTSVRTSRKSPASWRCTSNAVRTVCLSDEYYPELKIKENSNEQHHMGTTAGYHAAPGSSSGAGGQPAALSS